MMSEFEQYANDLWTGIQVADRRVQDFGYNVNPSETMSQTIGMFITWLTATEEVRQNSLGNSGYFTQTVIEVLPETDDPNWNSYIDEPKGTLKQRAESLWGIRIAFTHGNGDIELIISPRNKEYARNAENFLPGVELRGNTLKLNSSISNHAIRTIVQIRELLE